MQDLPGHSVFFKDPDGSIFHTYSSYGRGTEDVIGAYMYLDLTPNGRNENGPYHSMIGLDEAPRTNMRAPLVAMIVAARRLARAQQPDRGVRLGSAGSLRQPRPCAGPLGENGENLPAGGSGANP